MSNQDRTLDHYQELMTINATSHVLRAGRQIGLFDELGKGQKTLEQLAEALGVSGSRLSLLIDTLIAIGIIERYQEDLALSATARLLCQYDADLDDSTWEQLADTIRANPPASADSVDAAVPQQRFDSIAATQWVHTPAAMQAAEILDFGPGEEAAEPVSQSLLDLGCGSAVWSCAMAFRDPGLHITAIDTPAALVAAEATASSIGLDDRFETQPGDLLTSPLPDNTFDWVVIAQRLHSLSPEQIEVVLARAYAALRQDGTLVVIDSFGGPNQPSLAESLEVLRVQVQTEYGAVPKLPIAQARMAKAGYENVQFTFIAASRLGLGLMTGVKR
ncbi:class I SAM-dependent methyltransferase [Neorhodopirellula lusitana]|uniref:class I SAM-dependent methyltransferase n=1 Tax=Neorhodopirellula lusitana TaxID=445327 RepID=UPI00384B9B52